MILTEKLNKIIESSVGDEQNSTDFRASAVSKKMDTIGNRLLRVTNQRSNDLYVGSAESILILATRIALSESEDTSPMFRNLVDLPVTADEVEFKHTGVPEISSERLQSVGKMLER